MLTLKSSSCTFKYEDTITHMHTHTRTHTHAHTHTHKHTHACTHAILHTCSHTFTHAHTQLYTHAHTHTYTHTHANTHTHKLTHMLTHNHTCAYTHKHTHIFESHPVVCYLDACCTDCCRWQTEIFKTCPVARRGGAVWPLPATLNAYCLLHRSLQPRQILKHILLYEGVELHGRYLLPGMPAAQITAASTHQILKHILLYEGVELHGRYLLPGMPAAQSLQPAFIKF